MNARRVASELARMASHPGIVGCALVDATTGLVWHSSGAGANTERMWEAAVDYWRLHDRQKTHFADLGVLAAAVMYHSEGVLAIIPCSSNPDLLLISQGRHGAVDWTAWQRMARGLGKLIHSPN